MKTILSFVLFLIFSATSPAQIFVTGNLLSHIDSIITAMPSGIGTNDYKNPNSTQSLIFGTAVEDCFKKKYSDAASISGYCGYNVVAFTDTTTSPNHLYYILQRGEDSLNHWGTFVFNPSPLRSKLVIQSPHELFDTKTGSQGAFVFKELSASAFFLNGAHRCNNSTASTCSGTTTACSGNSASFKISDQAHEDEGTFQLATIVLLQQHSDAAVVQLHGFGKGAGDPDAILGNGTAIAPSGTDFLKNFKNALSTIDTSLTFKIAHLDTSWTELTGTTNTQGRLVNGSANPCGIKASAASGRFLHIEQAYAKLRDTKTNWQKVADALAQTFVLDPTSVNDHQNKPVDQFFLLQNYPNPFNPATVINYQLPMNNHVTLKVYDALGREVVTLVNEMKKAGSYSSEFNAAKLASGIYFYRLQAGEFVETQKMVLMK